MPKRQLLKEELCHCRTHGQTRAGSIPFSQQYPIPNNTTQEDTTHTLKITSQRTKSVPRGKSWGARLPHRTEVSPQPNVPGCFQPLALTAACRAPRPSSVPCPSLARPSLVPEPPPTLGPCSEAAAFFHMLFTLERVVHVSISCRTC